MPRLAPPSTSSPSPEAWRRSISAQSSGAEQRHQRAGLLLHPPKCRDVLVGAEQDPGLARARLRGEVGLPLGQVIAVLGDPAGHVRGAAVAHRAAQHRQREPVDLEAEQPRRRCRGRRRPAGARCPSTTRRVYSSSSLVPASTSSTIETAAITSDASSASPNEATAITSGNASSAITSATRVEQQHGDEAEHEHERQPQRRHQRRQDRVDHGDHRGDQERAAEVLEARRPGTIAAGDIDGGRSDKPRQRAGAAGRSRGLVGSHRGWVAERRVRSTSPPGSVIRLTVSGLRRSWRSRRWRWSWR